ncbi:hypothetical protein LCGC14_2287710, partial [marine sediment metagenome]
IRDLNDVQLREAIQETEAEVGTWSYEQRRRRFLRLLRLEDERRKG